MCTTKKTRSNENFARRIEKFLHLFSSVFIVFLLFGTSLVVSYDSNGSFRTFFYSKLKLCENVLLSCRNSAFHLDKYTFGLLLSAIL